MGFEVEGSGLLSLVLFFLRKPREGIDGAVAASHVGEADRKRRGRIGRGGAWDVGYVGGYEGIARRKKGVWMFGAVAGTGGLDGAWSFVWPGRLLSLLRSAQFVPEKPISQPALVNWSTGQLVNSQFLRLVHVHVCMYMYVSACGAVWWR